ACRTRRRPASERLFASRVRCGPARSAPEGEYVMDTAQQRFFKTGIVVTDLEGAMGELGKQLGVEWTPVQAVPLAVRTKAGLEQLDLRVVVSREGPTYLELIE